MEAFEQRRVRVNDSPIKSRAVPIGHLRVNATVSGSADTLLTVRTGIMLKVKQLAVVNSTGTAATLNLNSIPSGDSIGVPNAELVAVSIPANSAVDLTDFIGQLYEGDTVVKAYSDTSDALVVHGWAEEIL